MGERVDDPLEHALTRARAGDEEGFVVLWRSLQPPLLRYLTVTGNDCPEDLASETWLQVVRDLARFDGTCRDFRAWLFTVARHRAVDHGRARAARPSVPVAEVMTLTAGTDRVNGVTGSAESAESAALERLSTAQALELVATLPQDQAEMVMLRVVAGLDVSTVAALVGKSPGLVRVSVHRALRRLSHDPRVRPQGARSDREVVEQ